MSEDTKPVPDRSMSAEQKIAILLASLKESVAASILQRLEPSVLARVADAIRRLGVVPGETRRRVVGECVRGIAEARSTVHGNDQMVNNLLTRAIGEKRAAALLQESTTVRTAFANLNGMSAEQIISVLGREQPSVIAMVLRYLDPELAAQVLNMAPREVSKRVMTILCTGRPPPEAVIARVQEHLASRLGKSRQSERADTGDMIERTSSILQAVDHSLAEDVLQTIDEQSPALGTELRDRLFSFDDIVRLSDADMRRIMQELDMAVLAVALRSAPIDVREKFYANMSKRAVENLKEEMEYAPKMKISEIEAKQKEIINIIRELDGQGEISIQDGGANEYV